MASLPRRSWRRSRQRSRRGSTTRSSMHSHPPGPSRTTCASTSSRRRLRHERDGGKGGKAQGHDHRGDRQGLRSEEHTSELQSLISISYAVFCFKNKQTKKHNTKLNNTSKDDQN